MRKYLYLFTSALITTSASQLAMAFGIEARGVLKTYGQPVHEIMTRMAAIETGFLTEAQTSEMRHLVEGVRFNDDPAGYLLEEADGQSKRAALAFALQFLGKRNVQDDPTKASHFGDFQFLHAMGNTGEKTGKIKEKLMLYAYHCWLIASGTEDFASFEKNYEIVSGQLKNPSDTFVYNPKQTLIKRAVALFPREVLFFHAENQTQFRYRALGSLLHMVQDSFAKAHVVREGWSDGSNAGRILYFQDYGEQDSDEHDLLDNNNRGTNVDNLFEIAGTRAAFEKSKKIMILLNNQCSWTRNPTSACEESFYSFLNEDVFGLVPESLQDATGAHSHPDLKFKDDPFKRGGVYDGGG